MSLMTESLLVQAQNLRLEGALDESIDLLRVVLSQCDADLARAAENNAGRDAGEQDDGQSAEDESSGRAGRGGDAGAMSRQLRRLAAFQLALLLLQRSGRRSRDCDVADADVAASAKDEQEADVLLCKLGYRLRLSKLAFGYHSCRCRMSGDATTRSPAPVEPVTVEVVDNILPKPMFAAMQHALRTDSRYWTEFYCKANNGSRPAGLASHCNGAGETNTNQFASHNVPLPSSDGTLFERVKRARSLLEQVAIVTQYRLRERFPDIINASSAEVWSHKRPKDGQHQLHYDMDELLLWNHRKKLVHLDTDGDVCQEAAAKRLKTDCKLINEAGIACPIVSCVLTIDVPHQSEPCCLCGCLGGHCSAPTIICSQSIMRRSVKNEPGIGYLCYPSPNRLLAFEGSLLHGVVPGIPFLRSSVSSDDEDDSSCSDDLLHPKITRVDRNDQRITLMMGFWREVCLTESTDIGPNVPFGSVQGQNSWKEEFAPSSVSESDLPGTTAVESSSRKSHVDVDPLWIPIHNNNSFGDYADGAEQFYGRFFLKASDPTCIDDEVLSAGA